jgi:hypothetical protein
MSDEGRTQQAEASIHVEHYCCIPDCGKWGGLGYSRTRGEPVQWWCATHYPNWPEHIAERYRAEAL